MRKIRESQKIEEFENYKIEWLNSDKGLIETIEEYNKIAQLIDEKFKNNEKEYNVLNLELIKGDCTRLLQTEDFGARLTLINHRTSNNLQASRYRVFLTVELIIFGYVEEKKKYFNYYPVLNTDRKIVWESVRDQEVLLNSINILEQFFTVFFNFLKEKEKQFVQNNGLYFETDLQGTIIDNPFCPKCYEVYLNHVHLSKLEDNYFGCPVCKNFFGEPENTTKSYYTF